MNEKNNSNVLQTNSKENDNISPQLENIFDILEAKIEENILNLKEEINILKEENLALKNLPIELGNKLKELVPDITKELQRKAFEDYDINLKACKEKLTELTNNIESANNKIQSYEQATIKKKVLSFGATVLFSTIITFSFSYFIMQKFPKFIKIETNGNINIERSKVSIWENSSFQSRTKINK